MSLFNEFTNKASAEMRARIGECLDSRPRDRLEQLRIRYGMKDISPKARLALDLFLLVAAEENSGVTVLHDEPSDALAYTRVDPMESFENKNPASAVTEPRSRMQFFKDMSEQVEKVKQSGVGNGAGLGIYMTIDSLGAYEAEIAAAEAEREAKAKKEVDRLKQLLAITQIAISNSGTNSLFFGDIHIGSGKSSAYSTTGGNWNMRWDDYGPYENIGHLFNHSPSFAADPGFVWREKKRTLALIAPQQQSRQAMAKNAQRYRHTQKRDAVRAEFNKRKRK